MQNCTDIRTDIADFQANDGLKAAASSNDNEHHCIHIYLHKYLYLIHRNQLFFLLPDLRQPLIFLGFGIDFDELLMYRICLLGQKGRVRLCHFGVGNFEEIDDEDDEDDGDNFLGNEVIDHCLSAYIRTPKMVPDIIMGRVSSTKSQSTNLLPFSFSLLALTIVAARAPPIRKTYVTIMLSLAVQSQPSMRSKLMMVPPPTPEDYIGESGTVEMPMKRAMATRVIIWANIYYKIRIMLLFFRCYSIIIAAKEHRRNRVIVFNRTRIRVIFQQQFQQMSYKQVNFRQSSQRVYGKSLQKEPQLRRPEMGDSYMERQFVRTNMANQHFKLPKFNAFAQKISDNPYYSSQVELYQSTKSSKKLQWKLKDINLRETEDSMRQQHKRKPITIKDFKLIKMLGKGKHGTVFLALHRQTGFIGALKVFRKEECYSNSARGREELLKMLIKELKIQSFASHSYVLSVYSIFSDEQCVYLFMELGTDGQLFDLFQKRETLKEETIAFILKHLLDAVNYLHKSNIIHRDLKPQNIVLIHGFPKICDFGESNLCNKDLGQLRETLCGTPLYLSPEILMGEKYDQKIDIWALGALAYELYTGNNPFNIKHKDELNKIITEEFHMTRGSIQLRNFLNHVLKKNPKERPSASKLLLHPFIKKWKDIETSQQLCPK